jgi:hypothetical protein
MLPENMPGYHALSQPQDTAPDKTVVNLVTSIFVDPPAPCGDSLHHVPVCFGTFKSSISLERVYKASPMYNSELVLAARTITHFTWVVYSFNDGHFVSLIQAQALPFRVVLCADVFAEGRALFKEFTRCPLILSGVRELYDHVHRSGD